MRIAILSYEYPRETGFGGIGSYAYYHARALVKLGHTVHVFSGSTQAGIYDFEDDGVRLTRIKTDGWLQRVLRPARAQGCYWFHNRVEAAYTAYVAVSRALRGEQFDIIEAPECGADAAALSLVSDIPLVIRFHSPARLIMNTYRTGMLDRKLTAFVEQIPLNRADMRTACSAFVAEEVMARMGVRPPVHVIPNGIDVELFDAEPAVNLEQRFGLPRDATIVLFANRMEKRKGVHLLADIAMPLLKRHPDLHFVLAGRDLFGCLHKRVLPRIQSEGLEGRFHFLGALEPSDVRTLCKRADVFLLPSLWENCPYSCLEAMTARCAVVSSDCGGMPELIQDRQNGLLARTGDVASFVKGIGELVDDSRLRERLGAAARTTVEERLRDTEIAARTLQLYQQTLAGRQRATTPS